MGLRKEFEKRLREELAIVDWLVHAIAMEIDRRVFEGVEAFLPTEREPRWPPQTPPLVAASNSPTLGRRD